MRNNRTDSGSYAYPALIQAPAPYVNDGQGGNSAANQWVTVRGAGPQAFMVHLQSGNFGRGGKRSFQFGQLYPTASHWVEFRDDFNQVTIDPTMTLVVRNRRFQILGAFDPDLEHVIVVMALVEYQAKGTK